MFGFGMSAIDKAILAKTEVMLAGLGLSGPELKATARKMFDEVKSETETRHGEKAYAENMGDHFIQNPKFMEKRRAAGLTEDDVKKVWNRCLLIVFIETKVRELINFVVIDAARQSGRDLVAAFTQYRKSTPIYGDPETWDPSKPVNVGFSVEDADLYLEHASRVEAWTARTPEAHRQQILAKYTSFNAMVRDNMRKGRM